MLYELLSHLRSNTNHNHVTFLPPNNIWPVLLNHTVRVVLSRIYVRLWWSRRWARSQHRGDLDLFMWESVSKCIQGQCTKKSPRVAAQICQCRLAPHGIWLTLRTAVRRHPFRRGLYYVMYCQCETSIKDRPAVICNNLRSQQWCPLGDPSVIVVHGAHA